MDKILNMENLISNAVDERKGDCGQQSADVMDGFRSGISLGIVKAMGRITCRINDDESDYP